MAKKRKQSVAPEPAWATPASTWNGALERYTTFLQVPTWRASVKRDGSEKAACLSADQAHDLRKQMEKALGRVLGDQQLQKTPKRVHLKRLWERQGRGVARAERCPSKLQTHFQRAMLLNEAGYKCGHCHRTAWSVFSEDPGKAPARTLRFEVDHHVTRQRLTNRDAFDEENLAVVCRSCNVIKGEMLVDQFLSELRSLSRAVVANQPQRS